MTDGTKKGLVAAVLCASILGNGVLGYMSYNDSKTVAGLNAAYSASQASNEKLRNELQNTPSTADLQAQLEAMESERNQWESKAADLNRSNEVMEWEIETLVDKIHESYDEAFDENYFWESFSEGAPSPTEEEVDEYLESTKPTLDEPNTAEPQGDIVYVTPYGTKYHADWCRYVKDNARSMTEDEAIRKGYSACSVCGG